MTSAQVLIVLGYIGWTACPEACAAHARISHLPSVAEVCIRCYHTADERITRASAVGQRSLLLAILPLLALLLLPPATFPLAAAAAACRLACA